MTTRIQISKYSYKIKCLNFLFIIVAVEITYSLHALQISHKEMPFFLQRLFPVIDILIQIHCTVMSIQKQKHCAVMNIQKQP